MYFILQYEIKMSHVRLEKGLSTNNQLTFLRNMKGQSAEYGLATTNA